MVRRQVRGADSSLDGPLQAARRVAGQGVFGRGIAAHQDDSLAYFCRKASKLLSTTRAAPARLSASDLSSHRYQPSSAANTTTR